MAEKKLNVMISSTSLDLPEHRKNVMHACLRLGLYYPDMMEHLTADTAPPLDVSLKMVDEADLYIGIFGVRYGTIPAGQTISITEAEYNRAVERNKPRLIFLMSDDHNIKASYLRAGDNLEKLATFKERVKNENTVAFFDSAEDLLAKALQALLGFRKPDVEKFHYVSDIPTPPDTYIAHPYTLLQTGNLVGRQPELNKLTDWVSKTDSDTYKTHILNVVAIGGMGKSALTWKWFDDVATREMKPLAGRMWWSFYESDATFENFVMRALAYISGRPIEEIRQIPAPDRETELLAALDQRPFLIVLDGLERILIAYARGDAARLNDAQVGSQKNVRKTSDPRAGQFLRKLAHVKNSRILISTRLFPAELETDGGDTRPGVSRIELKGLTEDDALDLWRAFGVSGSRDLLQPIFDSIDKHPLLIQALAGEIKRYKKAPGNFEKWHEKNPAFDPTKFPKVQEAMGHVMEYALQDLEEKPRNVLNMISAFRMPTGYETLMAIVLASGGACETEAELDSILIELEDRGLVGWDKRANRYDLHPIVRGIVWGELGNDARQGVYTSLHAHFEAVPMIENWQEVESLEDLTPAIEMYNTLIGMGRYEDAFIVFLNRLSDATLYRLSASRQRVKLLEMLFPDGLDDLPRLSRQDYQAFALNTLAAGYQFSGQPGQAAPLLRRHNAIRSELGDNGSLGTGLRNLSYSLVVTGGLRESEEVARRALGITRQLNDTFREAVALQILGLAVLPRGETDGSVQALQRSLRIWVARSDTQGEGMLRADLAQRAIWSGEYAKALSFANRALELANIERYERDFIRSARLRGEAMLGLEDLVTADEKLHYALTRGRNISLIEEELPALIALAELRRRQGDEKAAREFLDDVWEYAARGPYPLFHADALNVLTRIERDAGNTDEAIRAATKAYELSWCDGPPYAYHWGLIKARKHLEELGAPLPDMPPFDETKFEPMPEVEIDPDDEFHIGESLPS
jgi:tetratricopeptide (TPR) repeat protein